MCGSYIYHYQLLYRCVDRMVVRLTSVYEIST